MPFPLIKNRFERAECNTVQNSILYEKQGYIGIITINRPAALNAINSDMLDELYELVEQLKKDSELRCLIMTGSGKAFVAGADISEMKDLTREQGYDFGIKGHTTFCALENLEVPIIAAINGYALGGGCELALCADIRIASSKAKFAQPEVGLGITPGFGGTQRLARIVGVSNAMELAQAIAANAQVAVRQSKAAIRHGLQTDMYTGAAFEAEAFGLCFSTEDQKDAMTAFVNKDKVTSFKNR